MAPCITRLPGLGTWTNGFDEVQKCSCCVDQCASVEVTCLPRRSLIGIFITNVRAEGRPILRVAHQVHVGPQRCWRSRPRTPRPCIYTLQGTCSARTCRPSHSYPSSPAPCASPAAPWSHACTVRSMWSMWSGACTMRKAACTCSGPHTACSTECTPSGRHEIEREVHILYITTHTTRFAGPAGDPHQIAEARRSRRRTRSMLRKVCTCAARTVE